MSSCAVVPAVRPAEQRFNATTSANVACVHGWVVLAAPLGEPKEGHAPSDALECAVWCTCAGTAWLRGSPVDASAMIRRCERVAETSAKPVFSASSLLLEVDVRRGVVAGRSGDGVHEVGDRTEARKREGHGGAKVYAALWELQHGDAQLAQVFFQIGVRVVSSKRGRDCLRFLGTRF